MRIDNEFRSLIPPLTAEEYAGLEQSIIQEGCRDSLVTWFVTHEKGYCKECLTEAPVVMGDGIWECKNCGYGIYPFEEVLVDGHNRYEICRKHGIPFNTTIKGFDSREQVKEWIILNQFGRRNLSAYDRSLLALKLKDLFAEKAKINKVMSAQMTNEKLGNTVYQISEKPLEKINTTKELAKIAGVSHDTIHKVETIEQKAPEEVKQKIKNGELSINKAYTYIKRQEIKENTKQIEPPKDKYRIIYADPPWQYNDKRDGNTTGAEDHYPTMSIQELCELPIKELAEDNAVLFLWVTSPMLEECFAVINVWGFKYKTSFVWDKVKHNMGHYNSVRHELLLVCTKGSCLPDNNKLFDSVVSIERSDKHSEKPEEFRRIIDELYPEGNRIELFARKKIDNWEVWGNEA